MRDDLPFYAPNRIPASPRQAQPGELLFEFHVAKTHRFYRCEFRFHGESYGWEAQFFERGDLVYSRGGFVLRAFAVQWAEEERKALEVG